MLRRAVFAAVLGMLPLANSAPAAQNAAADSAADVRLAVVAAAAYAEDNGGSYRGMTTAKLRRYSKVRNVTVRRPMRRTYCIESVRGRRVHFDGPRGPLRYGRCGVRGAVVPKPRRTEPVPQPADAAQRQLRNASIAALAFYTDHGTYTGMTLAKLQTYDKTIASVLVDWTRPRDFCLESSATAGKFHLRPRDFKPTAGACPAPPA